MALRWYFAFCVASQLFELTNGCQSDARLLRSDYNILTPVYQGTPHANFTVDQLCGVLYTSVFNCHPESVKNRSLLRWTQASFISQLSKFLPAASVNGAVYFASSTLNNAPVDIRERLEFHAERLTWSFQLSLNTTSCPIFMVYSMEDKAFFDSRFCSGTSRAVVVPPLRCFFTHCLSKHAHPWSRLDGQRTTDHYKYALALAMLELGHRTVFLDTDVFFAPTRLSVQIDSDAFDFAIKLLTTTSLTELSPDLCESRSGFLGTPCGSGPAHYACICTCIMAFNPTAWSISFLRSVVEVLHAEPNLWEQDLVSKLLPLHMHKGLVVLDLTESFAIAHNFTVYRNGGFAHPNPFQSNSLIYHSGDKGHIPEGFCVATNSSWCWRWGLLP